MSSSELEPLSSSLQTTQKGSSMNPVSGSDSVRLGIIISALVCLGISPDACTTVTNRADFALTQSLGAQAPAPNYTYTVIADVSNCFNIGSPVLNNEGEAAFVANCGAPIGPQVSVVVRRGTAADRLPRFTRSGRVRLSVSPICHFHQRQRSRRIPWVDRSSVADSLPRSWSAMGVR